MLTNPAPTAEQFQSLMTPPTRVESGVGPCIDVLSRLDPERAAAEDFIGQRFANAHNAQVVDFLPWLIALRCTGKYRAAAGLNLAQSHPLFLEQYLDRPIEIELSDWFETGCSRGGVVEIGNLASTGSAVSLALFVTISEALHTNGFHTLVFTATSGLRKKFNRLGFELSPLARARQELIQTNSLSDWGSYYCQDPMVIAGSLAQSHRLINESPLFRCIRLGLKNAVNSVARSLQQQGIIHDHP